MSIGHACTGGIAGGKWRLNGLLSNVAELGWLSLRTNCNRTSCVCGDMMHAWKRIVATRPSINKVLRIPNGELGLAVQTTHCSMASHLFRRDTRLFRLFRAQQGPPCVQKNMMIHGDHDPYT